MWAMSERFATALNYSLTVVTKIELRSGYRTLLSTPTAELNDLVVDGSVTVDADAASRRRLSLTIATRDASLVPAMAGDSLSPYGNEIQVFRGIQFPDGTAEFIPLGVFRISRSTSTDNGKGDIRIKVDAYDRARSVSRNIFNTSYYIDQGQNIGTALQALIFDRLPGVQFRFAPTGYTTTQMVFDAESDPWAAAVKIANSIGMDLYFDNDGVCVMQPVMSVVGVQPEWTYTIGEGQSLLTTESTFDDENGFSGVRCVGESTSNGTGPVSALVWDTNPDSPTYYLGPYGKVVKTVRSNLYGSSAQCADAARRLILKASGATQQVSFTSLVNPAHEVFDVIRVTNPNVKVDDTYLLSTFTIPLGLNNMPATVRKVALVGDELSSG